MKHVRRQLYLAFIGTIAVSIVMGLLLVSITPGLTRGPALHMVQAGGPSRYFAETAHTVSGRFLTYWQDFGDLPVFGYPLSEEFSEKNELDGKMYTVQYFERARFELHPENLPPYDVLLGQLGRAVYQQRYQAGAPNQQKDYDQPRRFSETGFVVGGKFRTYWEIRGGLPIFGYPISNEIQEISDTDGKTHTVQYFERARFELHPENLPPYDVLLGQLGKVVYQQHDSSDQQGSGRRNGVVSLVTQTVAGEVVAGHGQLFWIDSRNGGHAVYGYDPTTQQEYLVSDGPNGALTSNGKVVTWLVHPDSNHGLKVQRYDPASKQQRTIAVINYPPSLSSPFEGFLKFAADTQTLYYVGGKDFDSMGLYARDLTNGKDQLIIKGGLDPEYRGPVAADGLLVWHDMSYVAGLSPHTKLHAWRQNGADTILVDSSGCPDGYAVSGTKVVWALNCAAIDFRVYMADLQSGETKPISAPSPADVAHDPLISDNLVAWVAEPGEAPAAANQWALITYDLISGAKQILVTSNSGLRALAIVDEKAVAYLAPGEQGLNLYLAYTK